MVAKNTPVIIKMLNIRKDCVKIVYSNGFFDYVSRKGWEKQNGVPVFSNR